MISRRPGRPAEKQKKTKNKESKIYQNPKSTISKIYYCYNNNNNNNSRPSGRPNFDNIFWGGKGKNHHHQ